MSRSTIVKVVSKTSVRFSLEPCGLFSYNHLFVSLFVCLLYVYHEVRLEKYNKIRINELSFMSFAGEVRDRSSLYFSMFDLV